MTKKPIIIDEMSETDVYVASIELRSVGSSQRMYPSMHFSHHFSDKPQDLPASYLAVIEIAKRLSGGTFQEEDLAEEYDDEDLDVAALKAELALSEGDDGTRH